MTNETLSTNSIGLPGELVPLLAEKTLTCEYASVKGDGTPITAPLGPFPGENGQTIDLATGLTYPLKAERARKNPKVCLLYSEPKASLVANPPIILVYGGATVHDADLQANLDRMVQISMATSPKFANTPPFLLRWLSGYLARIWISVTPFKILWWPEGDISKPPKKWLAPDGTQAPPSDPPPKPLATPHKAVVRVPDDWREDLDYAVKQMGLPTLTIVDEEGYPVPFRTLGVKLDPDGARLLLPETMPAEVKGRACLNFYTLQVKDDDIVANEAVSFIGYVTGDDEGALFEIERQLPNLRIGNGLRGTLSTISEMRKMGKRADVEAARRGQPAPKVRL